ncbi:putative signal transducing protein [Humisphaera borealis]|uniref:DUF2007 domain-containing protein n=1 Tax=Humisphaera borealis TaxID=2807512 RepID=A0A7M2WPU3_9BACT|nr:DUF2007 domain-containing protein [Humisphaera borealis]QOV87488.1 DUF2007 domain-containing protein [Humisphaera borealis]
MTTPEGKDASKPSPPPTLSYASAGMAANAGDNLVTIEKCANVQEAAMRVNVLEAAGIHAVAVNENVQSLGLQFAALVPVEVQVRQEDESRAREVLRVATSDDVEPADDQPQTLPATETDGVPIELAEVARFDNIRALREAALLLESARIRSVPPKLVVRQGEAGVGKRFKLLVPADDADRAMEILADLDEDTDEEELRCPKCGSWKIYPVGQLAATVKWFLRMGDKPVEMSDCLECKYRGVKAEFERA